MTGRMTPWTPDEDATIIRRYPVEGGQFLCVELYCTPKQLKWRAYTLGATGKIGRPRKMRWPLLSLPCSAGG